jgi:hypothetical protein
MYASFLGISGALYLDLFEQPVINEFFRKLLISKRLPPLWKREVKGDLQKNMSNQLK